MALKSNKIRKLGIEDLEQVLHIQEIITRNKIGPKKTSYWREHVQFDWSNFFNLCKKMEQKE